NATSVHSQAAGYQFGFIIQQAYMRGSALAEFVQHVHGDGIALDRVDIEPITQTCCNAPTSGTCTYYDRIEHVVSIPTARPGFDAHQPVSGFNAGNFTLEQRRYAPPCDSFGKSVGKFVNISGAITWRVKPAVIVAAEGRLNALYFLRTDCESFKPTARQYSRYPGGVFERAFIAINMQDALFLAIEIDVFCGRPGKQM